MLSCLHICGEWHALGNQKSLQEESFLPTKKAVICITLRALFSLGWEKIGEAKTHERRKGYQGITEHSSAAVLPKEAPMSMQKYCSAISLPVLWAESLVFGWFSLASGVHPGTHHLPTDGKHRLSI